MAPAGVHKDLLKVLVKAKPSLRKAILKEGDKALVYSICEICENTLSGRVPLSAGQRQKIQRHKNIIRKLAKKGESWKKKKAVLIQHGSGAFIPLLLNVLGPILGSLLFK